MQNNTDLIVILGTGGTIAGMAADVADNVGYTAAQIGVADLVAAIPPLALRRLECEQLAQLDSKDMDFATWQRLVQRIDVHLARPEVRGIVITHGTDTLEETAYFLQRVLAPSKPVVLTAAMRPATALQADGPQNLLDAVVVADDPTASGVLVVIAGSVHTATQVRKVHTYQIDAFASVDGAKRAVVEEGRVRWLLNPAAEPMAFGLASVKRSSALWPQVQIVWNHVGADGVVVRALMAQGVDGIVVAGTGNGTVSTFLEAALCEAQASGVMILRSTRCDSGPVIDTGSLLPMAGTLSPVKARIELLLQLLTRP